MRKWSLTSWEDCDYQQAATYHDKDQLATVVEHLSSLPPLVTSGEIKNLRKSLILAEKGSAFILQGGDCAESFSECRPEIISNKLKIILQMSLILLHGLRKPIIRVGRIAGQYAKPRSTDYETINGVTLPSYRGDIVNSQLFDEQARIANPKLMLQGYSCAAMTLNYIRALVNGGFADLNHPHQWDLRFVKHSPQAKEYQEIVKSIAGSLEFLETIDGIRSSSINKVDFYTSHEALHLHYEQALTRCEPDGLWYNLSTHFPWVGMRTAIANSSHIEFLRGIQNPIGIKVGPSTTPEWLVELLNTLNPNRENGRIMLITRLGVKNLRKYLPGLIRAVKKANTPVTWSCDPMHGNTEVTADGIKTRHFDNILEELTQALNIHKQENSHLGGVHFELTGENVTECMGGARCLNEEDLKRAYQSLVDPRLNYEQSLEMALQISRQVKI